MAMALGQPAFVVERPLEVEPVHVQTVHPEVINQIEQRVEADELALIEAEIEVQKKTERERLVRGIDNDDLNAMLRTFDKQVQNVHICPPPYEKINTAALDLRPSPDEDFTVEKLTSNLERFYASVVTGVIRGMTEIQRIRNWEDGGTRTGVALLAYSLAWYLNLITTSFLLFLATLVLFPPARHYCFASPSRSVTSQDQTDWSPSATESKASEWASTMRDTLTSLTNPAGGAKGFESQVTEEVNGVMVSDMKKKEDSELKDKSTKDKAIALYGKPAMRIIGGLADKWERIANALDPTPPFLLEPHRARVFCWLIAPILFVSTFVSERMFSRVFGLIFGFAIFGQPVITRTLEELDKRFPHWIERTILENNILSDVPTNAQLIMRLLRDAEHKRHPLPPPPETESIEEPEEDDDGEEEEETQQGGGKKITKGLAKATTKAKTGMRSKARRAWDKAGRLKEESFAWVTGHKHIDYESKAKNTLDTLHMSEDTKPAQALLKRLPSGDDEDSPDTPSRFYVHHVKHGPGHIILHPPTVPVANSTSFTPARITFTTIRHVAPSRNVSLESEDEPSGGHLTISINDVVSLKKEGMNLPGRVLTSWALDTEGAGGTGLEIKIIRRDVVTGLNNDAKVSMPGGKEETIKLKSIVRRNELFGRLLALGEQRWEML
nr:uncharacterized protein CI109_005658 [Kwoniella shandongensis]KAA5526062.1 hypothetical protein CI109_005658 [Kwoniella shandongensis]